MSRRRHARLHVWIACAALLLAGCFDLDRLRAHGDGASDGGTSLADLGGRLVSRCPDLGVQLCDGFEGDALDGKWGVIPHGGSVEIDPSFAYAGLHSLAINSAATNVSAQVEISESNTFPSSDIYMRAFVFLPSTTPATPLRLLNAYQATAPYLGISLYATPTSSGFAPRVYDGISDSTVDTTMPSFATDRWVCLEWEVVQANPGRVRVWVDDTEYPDLAFAGDTTTSPPFGVVSFGLLISGGDLPASTIWIDEVIVDDARITCAK